MSLLDQMRKGLNKIISYDPDTMILRGQQIPYAYANANAGSVGENAGEAVLALNETPYIFAVGLVDWREGDRFERRGKYYQIGAVSIDGSISGGIISTTAQVTEVDNG